MIYLNEGYKGGGTYFPTLQKTIEPETGKALWWHNLKNGKVQEQYLHEGVTVDEGKKYVVTSWWREKSWDGSGDAKLYYDSQTQKKEEEVSTKKSYVVKASELIKQEEKPVPKLEPKGFTSKEQISKHTELGFALQKCPPETWNVINDTYKLLKELNNAESIGPIMMGLKKPVHIIQFGASVDEIVNMTAVAVIDAQQKEKE